ncbi:hypothetical protein [Clostridium sp.]|uniref:hypothetical protein n=1 Tax=Clostridium sp. TaxID=1506 RepID=UPI002628B0FF|nr:hypothetical protein [Clostridium sp.]
MVKENLKNNNELYNDFQGIPLVINEICNHNHKDYDKSMQEPLFAFKSVEVTFYESEIEDYKDA